MAQFKRTARSCGEAFLFRQIIGLMGIKGIGRDAHQIRGLGKLASMPWHFVGAGLNHAGLFPCPMCQVCGHKPQRRRPLETPMQTITHAIGMTHNL
jgi:hypothetical protein